MSPLGHKAVKQSNANIRDCDFNYFIYKLKRYGNGFTHTYLNTCEEISSFPAGERVGLERVRRRWEEKRGPEQRTASCSVLWLFLI